MPAEWIFDPAPPSGKRTGGSAAEYSFEGEVDTLVREVVQNSLDARQSAETAVEIRFRLIELNNSALDRFLEGMRWGGLQDNLLAVPENRGGRSIRKAIEEMEADLRLRILVIEDRGTRGLEGTERRRSDNEKNSFCALVRDELYSDKEGEDAGGSFGLGKSVLWAYSSINTVLFASVPLNPPPEKDGLRLIGRTSLPYHETEDDGACTGDGWFGIPRDAETVKRRAESIWGEDARRFAGMTCCDRPETQPGLSSVIVGFAEPGGEDREASEVVERIVAASHESFWPAMVRGSLKIEVRHEINDDVIAARDADPIQNPDYRPLIELIQSFDAGRLEITDVLETGESAVEWVEIEVPQRIEEGKHEALKGRVAVLVTLLESENQMVIRDRIYRFRRPGMVVLGERKRNLSIGARPFSAVVVAGEACGSGEEFQRVEHFLRSAEPPEHNVWTHNTRSIKQLYKVHGAKAMLDRFEGNVLAAIRKLVSVPEQKGGALPKAILSHLRFGDSGGGGNPRFLSVTHEKAWPDQGLWKFKAQCRRVRPDGEPWHVRVRLKYAVDGGGGDDVHAISDVEAEGALRAEVRDGVGWIELPGSVGQVLIAGQTSSDLLPSIGTRAAVQLRVDGAKGELPDA